MNTCIFGRIYRFASSLYDDWLAFLHGDEKFVIKIHTYKELNYTCIYSLIYNMRVRALLVTLSTLMTWQSGEIVSKWSTAAADLANRFHLIGISSILKAS